MQALESLPYHTAKVAAICDHCNDKNMNSRVSQEACDKVYLCVYLSTREVHHDVFVLEVKERQFTLVDPTYGVEKQLFVDRQGAEG